MTDYQFRLAQALGRATFPPASWSKRFAHALARKDINDELSDKQAEWLLRLAYRYRRQMPADLQVAKPEPLVSLEDEKKLEAWNKGKALDTSEPARSREAQTSYFE
jgi:hypothetical protein